jgi:hypothetical protein
MAWWSVHCTPSSCRPIDPSDEKTGPTPRGERVSCFRPWSLAALVFWCASGLPRAEAQERVDFDTQIRPILQTKCVKCHARGKVRGGLSLETRQAILKGGESGPAAVTGSGHESLLVQLVAGLEPERRMPEKGEPLPPDQIDALRKWIDQGMAWPDGFTFGFRQATLAPRTPPVPDSPQGLSLENPVDRLLSRTLEEKGVKLDWAPVSDRTFARRASLDLVGLLPDPERVQAYEQDSRLDKAERLIDSLLADRRAYAEHWLTFWNDALRNAYRGTGFIDGGRKTITGWLFKALYDDLPYDRFVRELVSPSAGTGPEGFTKGIVWRGVVNASQAPPVQAAQNVAQVFLGTNLKCASCHDSFVNHWRLTDAYALASVFSDKPLEIHRCDKPTGKTSAVAFVYPELGSLDALAPRAERMKRLAELLTKPGDGRLARTVVNRLWAQLMGRGLVEPLDDMDQPSWAPDLLDWLAADFVAHGYDLKHTLARIATSRAYRLPSAGVAEPGSKTRFVFRGPLCKRMTAEQLADGVATVTGVWPRATADMMKVDGRGQGGQLMAALGSVGLPTKEGEPIRAALAFDDPLQTALGRTSREQVVTRRDGVATTLQALELTNGGTLDAWLKAGAAHLIEKIGRDPEALTRHVFQSAFGRLATPAEHETSVALLGRTATTEGVQDLLWAVVMLPEFQVIE